MEIEERKGVFIAKILITAALPYANGPLHLGHIRSTYLPADIYARYNRLLGNETYYVCATDEHGTPILASAEKAGKTPAEFTEYYHKKDEEEVRRLGFSFDIFHRTSSVDNKKMTQYFYTNLRKNGYIYDKEVEQAYCEKCSRFLPDRFVIGTCPHCNAEGQYSDYCDACGKALGAGEIRNPKCLVCGAKPTTRKSMHCFLALGKFSEKLKSWLSSNPELQKEILNYVNNWIENGLADWDITRDMNWGVPVPDRPGTVFYVWFDAPIGYASSTAALLPQRWEEFWKEGKEKTRLVHFIGKDIIYHHFLFWPAMLMGVGDGLRLPDAIPTRGHLNLEGRKFSKSKNWFVSLEDYLKEFDADYLRYYTTMVTPHSVGDADFVWKDFQQKINNELVACIGNYAHRTLVLLKKLANSEVPKAEKLEEDDERVLASMEAARKSIGEKIEKFLLKEGLEEICAFTATLNKYLSDREPWKEKDEGRRANCLYVSTRGLTALAILLEPYLPFTSRKMFAMLGISEKELKWSNVEKELLKAGAKIGEVKPLFEKVSDEKIEEQEKKLAK
ncbi:MAG: methionine--tRNA ligase [Candidatus Micrarchaeota archaeon]